MSSTIALAEGKAYDFIGIPFCDECHPNSKTPSRYRVNEFDDARRIKLIGVSYLCEPHAMQRAAAIHAEIPR